ncbi:MAG: hypothetical protein WCK90_06350, partial [archaeon]
MVKQSKKKGLFYSVQVIEKSLIHHVIEWVATILSALGAIFNSNLFGIQAFDAYTNSFYCWFVADILWIIFALKHKHWGIFTTFLIFGIINGLAILKNL